jgi:hypothetical protein
MQRHLPKLPSSAPLAVLSRCLAALLGGYALTYAVTAALARALPTDPVDAVVIGSLPAFAVYTAAIVWAFASRSATRAWTRLLLVGLPLGLFGFWPNLLERLS